MEWKKFELDTKRLVIKVWSQIRRWWHIKHFAPSFSQWFERPECDSSKFDITHRAHRLLYSWLDLYTNDRLPWLLRGLLRANRPDWLMSCDMAYTRNGFSLKSIYVAYLPLIPHYRNAVSINRKCLADWTRGNIIAHWATFDYLPTHCVLVMYCVTLQALWARL